MTGYVTTEEAAAKLGLTDSRIRQLIYSGEIQAHKAGAAVYLISLSEIARLKTKRKRTKRKAA